MDDGIKQCISNLDNPMWWISPKEDNGTVFKWTDGKGYFFESGRGVPSRVDSIFLYSFLLESQNNNWDINIITTRHKILKNCRMMPNVQKYKRLIESLERWKRVTISYKKSFYENKERINMEFGIINNWEDMNDGKKIKIELNKKLVEMMRATQYYKYVSFDQLVNIRSPLSLRLYELLIKSFYKRNVWEIGIHKLAAKIPMTEKYITHIIPKIKPAIKKICEQTDLNILVEVIRKKKNDGKFIFTKKNGVAKPALKSKGIRKKDPRNMKDFYGEFSSTIMYLKGGMGTIEQYTKVYRDNGEFDQLSQWIEYLKEYQPEYYKEYLKLEAKNGTDK